MFSVVKTEKKIIDSKIETIPDLWIRGKNAEKYFLCPFNVTKKQFSNAVQNCLCPMPNWQKIKCNVLESKFKTYQLAKATKDSIVRNLELKKKNGDTVKRLRADDGNLFETAVADLEAEEMDKVITNKVELAVAQHLKATQEQFKHTTIFDDIIEDKIQAALSKRMEGSEVVTFHTVDATTESTVGNDSTEANVGLETAVADELNDAVDDGKSNAEVAIAAGVEVTLGFDGNLGAAANTEADVSDIETCMPVKEDEHLAKLNSELENNFDYFRQKHNKKGAEILSATMTIVSNRIIDDNLLKGYSYAGQSGKKKFKIYENVTRLITLSTMDAFNNFNDDKRDFTEVSEKEVETHFTLKHIKYATQRLQKK